ncbi:MAG TPA: winged helix-turn-helix domain-containing protein [Bryobacteraceae bacterium]
MDLYTGELRKRGIKIKIQDQPFRILALLIENAGNVVRREEIRRALWPEDTFLDFENSLNAAVAKLRQVLGDSAENPRFIETLPRRGYRLLPSLEVSPAGLSGNTIEPIKAEPAPAMSGSIGRNRGWTVLAAGVALSALIALVVIAARHEPPARSQLLSYDVHRLTYTGDVAEAAISPDGRYVAYTTGANGDNVLRLRVLPNGSDEPVAGVPREPVRALAFSPDSKRIFFARAETDIPGDYYQVPVAGGVPTKMVAGVSDAISFSPDGSRFVFARWDPVAGRSSVRIARCDGGAERIIAECKFPLYFGCTSWCTRRDVIAFAGTPGGFFRWDVIVKSPDPAAPARVITPHRFYRINALAWMDAGRSILFEGQESPGIFEQQIFLLAYPSGKLTQLTNGLDWYYGISVTRDSNLLATVRRQSVSQLLLLTDRGEVVRRLTTPSSAQDGIDGVAFAGDRVVFASAASGSSELWSIDTDGRDRRQLIATGARNGRMSAPRDGKTIVFTSEAEADNDRGLWIMDADGANTRRVREGSAVPFVSPDATFIAFVAFLPGKRTLMRVDLDGTHPVVLSNLPAQPFPPAVSPDSRWIAFAYDESASKGARIAVIPSMGGAPVITATIPGSPWIQWTPDGKSLTYIRAQDGLENLWTVPIFGGRSRQVTHFNEGQIFKFAWSADGKRLAVAHGATARDVVLLRPQPVPDR